MGQLAGKIPQTFGSNAVETHVDGLPDQKIGFEIGPAGLEPATPCLEGRCSIHLSYGPTSSLQTPIDCKRVLTKHKAQRLNLYTCHKRRRRCTCERSS